MTFGIQFTSNRLLGNDAPKRCSFLCLMNSVVTGSRALSSLATEAQPLLAEGFVIPKCHEVRLTCYECDVFRRSIK